MVEENIMMEEEENIMMEEENIMMEEEGNDMMEEAWNNINWHNGDGMIDFMMKCYHIMKMT